MIGTLSCPALSPKPMTISDGRFNLFTDDPDNVDTRNMIYRMTLNTGDGRSLFFRGEKIIKEGNLLEVWPQTTTLYVTVSESETPDAAVLGKGVLRSDRGKSVKDRTKIENEEPQERGDCPYWHPKYWAAFILIGDPN